MGEKRRSTTSTNFLATDTRHDTDVAKRQVCSEFHCLGETMGSANISDTPAIE
jgi:hypothetical protein